jgi:hypothetical protein
VKIKNILFPVMLTIGSSLRANELLETGHCFVQVVDKVSQDSILPGLGRNPGLTQAYLMSIAKQGLINEFAFDDNEYVFTKYKPYTIILHESQFNNGDAFHELKYDGKLFAICDSGVFLSSLQMDIIRYYPYYTIQRIESGILTKRVLKRFAFSGGGIGLLAGAAAGSGSPASFGIGATVGMIGGAFYGTILSVYYIVGKFIYNKLSVTTSAMISASSNKWLSYREKVLNRSAYFRRIDISNFPLGDSTLITFPKAEKTEPRRTIVTIVDPNSLSVLEEAKADTAVSAVSEHRDNPMTDTTVRVVTSPAIVMPETKQTDWSQFKLGNGLASAWMYTGYQTSAVRVAYLAKQFGWIRQRTITDGDLAKLNTRSEIQFLAMWITTAAGYNFREVVPFNQDQVNFFLPKEPYLAETISPNMVIDPTVLLDLDIENLKVLFEALNKQP